MDKAKILVFYASTYDMLNEKQEQMKGCSLHYFFWGEGGELMLGQSEWNINEPVGFQRAKDSIPYELRAKVPVAPAIYEAEFYMTVGSNGKPVQKIKDLAYVCNVEMKEKVIPGLVVPGMVQPAAQPAAAPTEDKGKK